ncbi:MAG: S53 family serine peptidase [Candidatus Sulfotelmatobacter sp.]|jgi:hypothetical protein
MPVPSGYLPILGSERTMVAGANLLGPAPLDEMVSIRIVVRPRPDGPPMPDQNYFHRTPLGARRYPTVEEFAALYGSAQADLDRVIAFITSNGLTVADVNAGRWTVIATGTVAQMNAAFGVTLNRYEAPRHRSRRVRATRKPQPATYVYRGREGSVYLPEEIAPLVVAVLGLDNRSMARVNDGDPPNTNTLTVPTVTELYNFPTNLATNQVIGIYSSGANYDPTPGTGDIAKYYATLPSTYTAPTIVQVPPGSNNPSLVGDSDGDYELTQDIIISSTVAQRATIAVYSESDDETGWHAWVTSAVMPTGTEPAPTVLTTSWIFTIADDTTVLPADIFTPMTMAFQAAAVRGITVFYAQGDTGSDGGQPTDSAGRQCHVQYAGTDPWVTSCGGTTIGNVAPDLSSFDEVVWNDDDGATGGGVSDSIPLPVWQSAAGVSPVSQNPDHGIRRGVPDIAGNASPNSGYPIFVAGSPFTANGTSAVAPLYAGLTAVINAALNQQVGYLNPTLYALGSQLGLDLGINVFRDITSGDNNPNDGSGAPFYTAGPGWDACTGWGSVNGGALLSALEILFQRSITIVTQKSTFGEDESKQYGGVFQGAILAYVDGLTAGQFPGGGITALSTSTTPPSQSSIQGWAPQIPSPPGTNIQFVATAVSSDDPSLGPEVQRFTFTYNVVFPDNSAFTDASVTYPETLTITASLPGVASPPTAGSAQIEIITAADPMFANEANGAIWWLSEDLRAFYVEQGQTMFGLTLGSAQAPTPLSFIQQVITNLSGQNGIVPGSSDTFEGLPHAADQDSQLSALPTTLGGTPVYNFALARVRLTGVTEAAAKVRVFFRTWQAQSTAITYTTPASGAGPSPATGPFRQYSDGVDDGRKVPLLGLTSDGSEYLTVPFFATARVAPRADMTTQPEDAPYNVQAISPPSGGGTTYAYFGAWLDTNLTTGQFPLTPPSPNPDGESGSFSGVALGTVNQLYRGLHQCLVAEIVDDEAPILNGANPSDSDKLAQRNIAFVPVANPGVVSSRLVTHTFEIKHPATPVGPQGRPDELMIDWGNIPHGSVASIYLPTVAADEVIALAAELYTVHNLTATDPNTLQCPAGGITYIPIPPGSGSANYVGLFSIKLPHGITKGQQFNVVVRQLTSAIAKVSPPPPPPATPQIAVIKAFYGLRLSWRRVVGSFQVSAPVSTKGELLAPAERELSLMKWVAETIPATDRWYPVFQRYLAQLAGRVSGLGGNPGKVPPTATGTWPGGPGHIGHGGGPGSEHGRLEGKIAELLYDTFGDFEGFVLETYGGEERIIASRERAVEEHARRAWAERTRVRVFVHGEHGHRLLKLVLLHP